MENSAAAYNGTFAEVSTAAKRSGGFVMSGSATKTVGAVNTTTNIGITLKTHRRQGGFTDDHRPVVRRQICRNAYYQLGKTLQSRLAVARRGRDTDVRSHDLQPHADPAAASGKYNALFYCFENGALAAGSRVLLEINATYDLDGNASTPDDRSEMTYSVELTGKAAGEILRNGYYRIAANITGSWVRIASYR